MSEVLSTTEPYFSEVTINIKSQSKGPNVPPIKISHKKAKSKTQNSLIGPSALESDIWADLNAFVTHHDDPMLLDTAEAQLILSMPNRPISLFVTFYGCRKGSSQRSFETPTIFLSTSSPINQIPFFSAKKMSRSYEDATSPTASSQFITPSPSSYAHSLVCSPQASSHTVTSFAHLCNSFPSSLRLTPPATTRDISHEYDMTSELPPMSLPSSIYDCTPSKAPSLSSTYSAEGSLEFAKSPSESRILHDILTQFVQPSMVSRYDWSAVFSFVIGDTHEEQEQKKKDLKCASVPTVPQSRKRCEFCDGDCQSGCQNSDGHKSGWRMCRRGEFNPSLLMSEDYFSVPPEFEHIRAQMLVQRNEAPIFGYATNPVPFGDHRLAIGPLGDSAAFPPYSAPPVLDIERLGHSPSELCYQYC